MVSTDFLLEPSACDHFPSYRYITSGVCDIHGVGSMQRMSLYCGRSNLRSKPSVTSYPKHRAVTWVHMMSSCVQYASTNGLNMVVTSSKPHTRWYTKYARTLANASNVSLSWFRKSNSVLCLEYLCVIGAKAQLLVVDRPSKASFSDVPIFPAFKWLAANVHIKRAVAFECPIAELSHIDWYIKASSPWITVREVICPIFHGSSPTCVTLILCNWEKSKVFSDWTEIQARVAYYERFVRPSKDHNNACLDCRSLAHLYSRCIAAKER